MKIILAALLASSVAVAPAPAEPGIFDQTPLVHIDSDGCNLEMSPFFPQHVILSTWVAQLYASNMGAPADIIARVTAVDEIDYPGHAIAFITDDTACVLVSGEVSPLIYPALHALWAPPPPIVPPPFGEGGGSPLPGPGGSAGA